MLGFKFKKNLRLGNLPYSSAQGPTNGQRRHTGNLSLRLYSKTVGWRLLPQLLHTPQPSRLPNRELYFIPSPRAV